MGRFVDGQLGYDTGSGVVAANDPRYAEARQTVHRSFSEGGNAERHRQTPQERRRRAAQFFDANAQELQKVGTTRSDFVAFAEDYESTGGSEQGGMTAQELLDAFQSMAPQEQFQVLKELKNWMGEEFDEALASAPGDSAPVIGTAGLTQSGQYSERRGQKKFGESDNQRDAEHEELMQQIAASGPASGGGSTGMSDRRPRMR
jgi:hypothetical protein